MRLSVLTGLTSLVSQDSLIHSVKKRFICVLCGLRAILCMLDTCILVTLVAVVDFIESVKWLVVMYEKIVVIGTQIPAFN